MKAAVKTDAKEEDSSIDATNVVAETTAAAEAAEDQSVEQASAGASAMAASGWLRGKVKAVPSGDTLVIMSIAKADTIPLEKSITLSCIIAPRLARRHGTDEPFAWESREFLRKLCIGQEIKFKIDYVLPGSSREFGTVYLGGDKNIAGLVVAQGFAKVKEQGHKGHVSPYVTELLRLEEIAKDQGLGRWSKEHGAAEASVRILPSSTMGEAGPSDVKGFISEMKGKALEAIVEQVRDGSTIRVCLIPSFHFFQVYVAGVQAPSMGRRTSIPSAVAQTEVTNNVDVNGKASEEAQAPLLGTLQKAVASAVTYSEIPPDRFGKEAKHFTETKVLNREVRVILEGTDSFDNMFASVYYSDGNTAKDLALELVENGLAKYMEWSANMLGAETKRKLKNAELQAKKEQLRIWTGFQPPVTKTTPIHNQKFTGKVIEVVNGYCIVIADDMVLVGSPSAERRVNISSIRPPKLVDSSGESKTIEHFARAAKEFLRTRLIGKQVHVSMEYSRRINISNGHAADKTNIVDTRVLDYGSVFLPSQSGSPGNLFGANVAELLLSRGFADITRHRDYEERSHHYDALLAAYSHAEKAKKGYHAKKYYPATHMNDLTTVPAKKARDFFHLLQRNKRHSAVVEYIFSGHRFKLTIPNETSTITFSFSCVRCPGKNEPYSDDAIALMRRTILQHDVEIEIEAVDRTGTFLGSLWESKNNMAYVLLEAGLAKLSSFGLDRISDAQTLIRAEKSAQQKKLKVWENYNEAKVIPHGSLMGQNGKESFKFCSLFKIVVTEVIGGGKFYAHIVGDRRLDSIQQQLASMKFNDIPEIVPFNPTKGDVVLAQFTLDNSWNRAMIVSEHQGPMEREFLVFYIDYGNQEIVTYSRLRPAHANQSTSLIPPLAKLFRLAFIAVPNLKDNLGEQAARYLSMVLLDNGKEFKATIEERATVESKQEGQGTGEVLVVTLFDEDAESSINAAMLENGLAQIETHRLISREHRAAVKNLEEFQEHAKKEHRGIWRLEGVGVPDKSAKDSNACDINDDEDLLAPARAQPPSRGFDLIDLIASKSTGTPKPSREHVMGDSLP
ncbi:ribonuclease TUDOR 2-like [Setaria italica]|uniref:ribonuclease TUDOR 2-like n=1 Tax=Setaria italica TaxID=4555 RepID=UPI000BE4EC59|nr:ribonuclease TUDOR 2-like [Setaria italica]